MMWRACKGTGQRARDHHLIDTAQHTELVTVTTSTWRAAKCRLGFWSRHFASSGTHTADSRPGGTRAAARGSAASDDSWNFCQCPSLSSAADRGKAWRC
jgi:hypothetical protein